MWKLPLDDLNVLESRLPGSPIVPATKSPGVKDIIHMHPHVVGTSNARSVLFGLDEVFIDLDEG